MIWRPFQALGARWKLLLAVAGALLVVGGAAAAAGLASVRGAELSVTGAEYLDDGSVIVLVHARGNGPLPVAFVARDLRVLVGEEEVARADPVGAYLPSGESITLAVRLSGVRLDELRERIGSSGGTVRLEGRAVLPGGLVDMPLKVVGSLPPAPAASPAAPVPAEAGPADPIDALMPKLPPLPSLKDSPAGTLMERLNAPPDPKAKQERIVNGERVGGTEPAAAQAAQPQGGGVRTTYDLPAFMDPTKASSEPRDDRPIEERLGDLKPFQG